MAIATALSANCRNFRINPSSGMQSRSVAQAFAPGAEMQQPRIPGLPGPVVEAGYFFMKSASS